MLLIVKMPTNVVILTIISMINKTSESLKAGKVFIFQHFRVEISCSGELNMKSFITFYALSMELWFCGFLMWTVQTQISLGMCPHRAESAGHTVFLLLIMSSTG